MREFSLEYLLITIRDIFFYENEMRHFCIFSLEYLLIRATFLHIFPRISAHLRNKILNSRNSELRLRAYSSNPVENWKLRQENFRVAEGHPPTKKKIIGTAGADGISQENYRVSEGHQKNIIGAEGTDEI